MKQKKILIISPHFPPSNLAAVHRSRLFAQHLPSFGWQPVVLTVHEKFYEEALDYHLESLLPKDLRVEKVNAFRLTRPRLIGDIGLRGFFQLYRRAKQLIRNEAFDFVYIPIPSFYAALLGRWLHESTGVLYGIDYIDPWVFAQFGKNSILSRQAISLKIAKLLEPIAVKKASLISGVAEGYYKGVIERNPHLVTHCVFAAMPYGGEKTDHEKLKSLPVKPYLFTRKEGVIKLVYAGAMLPKAYAPLEAIFQSIKKNTEQFQHIEFHFIGTGKSPNDANGYNIKPLAEQYGLWQTVVFEYPKRIPYLDVLVHLEAADGVFILGSTEPHYTPSKVYQGILAGKPLAAVLHKASTAVEVIKKSNAGLVLAFDGEDEINLIEEIFHTFIKEYRIYLKTFDPAQVDFSAFDAYSAKAVTRQLSEALHQIIPDK